MQCENCEAYLEPTSDNFKCEDSGESFCTEFGTYHWWCGTLTCDQCGHKMDYQDQSI